MNAVNAVLLFILVWTFSAVCQADDDISVSCENVTGSVGKEVNLTCSVSLQNTDCCIKMYMFQYPESFNDSEICKENVSVNPCEQRKSFTCRYNSTTAMTEQFRFFVQTNCGKKPTEFTVDITASSSIKAEHKSKDIVIAAVVGCFILLLLLLIIIIMTIIRNKKPNYTKPCGCQKRMFLCIKHEEDNSTPPEDVI